MVHKVNYKNFLTSKSYFSMAFFISLLCMVHTQAYKHTYTTPLSLSLSRTRTHNCSNATKTKPVYLTLRISSTHLNLAFTHACWRWLNVDSQPNSLVHILCCVVMQRESRVVKSIRNLLLPHVTPQKMGIPEWRLHWAAWWW